MTVAPSRSGGLGLSLVAAASFSTSGSFAHGLIDAGWSPAGAVVIRCAVAAVLLAIPAMIEMQRDRGALRRGARTVIIYGVVTVGGCQICYFNAFQHMPVGLALLLEYLGIVLIVGWLWWKGQRPSRLTVAGSITALVGLWFVIDPSGDRHVDVVGVLWALGAAVGLASYFILSASTGDALPPATLACGGMVVGTITVLLCGAIGAVPLHATTNDVQLAGHHVRLWIPVLGLALVATAVPYVVGILAARRLGPKLASFVSLTEVIFAVIVAWLLLGELPSAWQILGGAIIIAGVALVRLDALIH